MKRSEVLAEITFILDTEWDLAHPDKANVILEKLESLGMLPPRARLGALGTEDNAWESEDG